MSDVSKQANGWASGPVLQSGFLTDLAHSEAEESLSYEIRLISDFILKIDEIRPMNMFTHVQQKRVLSKLVIHKPKFHELIGEHKKKRNTIKKCFYFLRYFELH